MTGTPHTANRGALFVLAAALLWGTTGTAAAFAPTVGPLAIGAAAMGIGGLLQGSLAARTIAVHSRILAGNWRVLALSAAAAAVYPLAFYSSMRMAGVAVGTVVSIGSAPLFAAIADFLSGRRAPSRSWLVGLITGVAGIGLLVCGPARDAPVDGSRGSGIALGFAAGATYAFYTWGATRLMRSGCPSRAAAGAVFGSAGLLLVPVVALTGGPIVAAMQPAGVVAYLAIVPMFVGYRLFGKGLETTSASTATILTLGEPAAAALIAVAVLGEQLPVIGWVGVVMLLASVASMTRVSARRAPISEPEHSVRGLAGASRNTCVGTSTGLPGNTGLS